MKKLITSCSRFGSQFQVVQLFFLLSVFSFCKKGKTWSKPSLVFCFFACVPVKSFSKHNKQTRSKNFFLELSKHVLSTSGKIFDSSVIVLGNFFQPYKCCILRQKTVRILVRKFLLVLLLLFCEVTFDFNRIGCGEDKNILKVYLKSSDLRAYI